MDKWPTKILAQAVKRLARLALDYQKHRGDKSRCMLFLFTCYTWYILSHLWIWVLIFLSSSYLSLYNHFQNGFVNRFKKCQTCCQIHSLWNLLKFFEKKRYFDLVFVRRFSEKIEFWIKQNFSTG